MSKNIRIRVPGSGGELLQGVANGKPFLVTCPIDRFAAVTLTPGSGMFGFGKKARQMMQLARRARGLENIPARIRQIRHLPVGKGMASSSADLALAAAAVGTAAGKPFSEREILDMAVSLEPTDGVFLRGIAAMEQTTGRMIGQYPAPPLQMALFDRGGRVNTRLFHEQWRRLLTHDYERYTERLLRQMTSALRGGDAIRTAQVATEGALLHGDMFPFLQAKLFWRAAEKSGAIGMTLAHSGTLLCAFWPLDASGETVRRGAADIGARMPALRFFGINRLIDGGIFYDNPAGKEGIGIEAL